MQRYVVLFIKLFRRNGNILRIKLLYLLYIIIFVFVNLRVAGYPYPHFVVCVCNA